MDKNSLGYRKLKVAEVTNNADESMTISFTDFAISFQLPSKDIKKFGLKDLSPGNIIFARSKNGIEDSDFWGGGLVQDIVLIH